MDDDRLTLLSMSTNIHQYFDINAQMIFLERESEDPMYTPSNVESLQETTSEDKNHSSSY